MKYLIDAQLPILLKNWLIDFGVEAIHTLELPLGNDTDDMEIISISVQQDLTIISKDSDFQQYRIIHQVPKKLLIVSTGNIRNKSLLDLFRLNFPEIHRMFISGSKVIELDSNSVTVHE